MQPAIAPQNEWVDQEEPFEQVEQPQSQPPANDEAGQSQAAADPLEALAAEAGWVNKDQWVQAGRDPNAWVPADQHLRTTIVKQREAAERVRELKQQTRQATRAADDYALRLERLERTTGAIIEQNAAEIRASVRAQYEAAKKAAAKDGDDERYDALDREQEQVLAEVNQRFAKTPEPDANQIAKEMLDDPVVGKFWSDHAWVAEDPDIYNYAYAVAEKAARAGKTEPEQIIIVKQMLREEYPERFANPRPQRDRGNEHEFIDPQDGTEPMPRDPSTGQFVARRDAAFYAAPQRRAPPAMSAGVRTPQGMRLSPEAAAARSLPPEAVRVFNEQSKAGRFKGSIVDYAKIYHGDARVSDI